jgi:hypothetical protein
MSKAHQNSNLNIQNSIIGLGDSAQAYFPFDRDTNDTIFRSTPSANSSTTILPEGIAIEEATTNVSLKNGQNGTTPWWGDGSPSVSIMDPLVTFRGRKAAKFTTGTSGNCYLDSSGDLSTATSATSWTLSCYIKRVDGTPITALSSYLYVSNNTNVNGSAVITPVEDGWYRAVYTRTARQLS